MLLSGKSGERFPEDRRTAGAEKLPGHGLFPGESNSDSIRGPKSPLSEYVLPDDVPLKTPTQQLRDLKNSLL